MINSKIRGVVSWDVEKISDDRGWLLELFREDCLEDHHKPIMAYVSATFPGVKRGPHEHKCQTDLFVFLGPGDFELVLWGNREIADKETHIVGEFNPCAVIVPPGVVHGYKNISDKVAISFNAPNKLYAGPGKRYPVDEIRHENREGSKFIF